MIPKLELQAPAASQRVLPIDHNSRTASNSSEKYADSIDTYATGAGISPGIIVASELLFRFISKILSSMSRWRRRDSQPAAVECPQCSQCSHSLDNLVLRKPSVSALNRGDCVGGSTLLVEAVAVLRFSFYAFASPWNLQCGRSGQVQQKCHRKMARSGRVDVELGRYELCCDYFSRRF
jgi:hypothetical protein